MDDQENVREHRCHEKLDPLSHTVAESGGMMDTEPLVIRRGGKKKGGCLQQGKEAGRGFGERRRHTANYIRILSSSLNAEHHSTGARSLPPSSEPSTGLSGSSGIDSLKNPPSNLYIMRGPEFLKCIESVQRLGSRLFKPALPTPNTSLQIHRAG